MTELDNSATDGRHDGRGVCSPTALLGTILAAPASADTGDLSYVGCVGNLPGLRHPPIAAAALQGSRAVAITPDGRHLYVAGDNGVSHFLDRRGRELLFREDASET